MTGYLHPAYAESLAEFGKPRLLPRSGGWILERPIPGFPYHDGMGCYPLFFCRDWSELHGDLADIESELISLAVVTDPFGDYDAALLQQSFDRVVAFKEHFVVDLRAPIDASVSRHHRYYARKLLKDVSVELCSNPIEFGDEWLGLYRTLTQRHNLKGLTAFSRNAFLKQLSVPGLVMFRAVHRGEIVGAHLWYVHADVAYSHLEATSEVGYRLRAAYALYWHAIAWFGQHLRWLDLGAGAGIEQQNTDGLTVFKRGWSTATRTVYFCGRIFERDKYQEVTAAVSKSGSSYFPAYRQDEFA